MGVANEVIEIRKQNPCATLQFIGDKVGVSKERVRQILCKKGLKTRKFTQHYICNNCGNKITKQGKLFCGIRCQKEYYNIPCECDNCHQIFYGDKNSLIRRLQNGGPIFCSRRCRGVYLGDTYGWGKQSHTKTCKPITQPKIPKSHQYINLELLPTISDLDQLLLCVRSKEDRLNDYLPVNQKLPVVKINKKVSTPRYQRVRYKKVKIDGQWFYTQIR